MRQRIMIAIALPCDPKLIIRRRADDRTRCDDPGSDPRTDKGADAPARRDADRHLPRPQASVHDRAAALGAAARPDRAPAARFDPARRRLLVSAALPLRYHRLRRAADA